jgi:chemotaxis protein CheC
LLKSYKELNERHVDTIGEIGSIGAGNAASSLSRMLGENVAISVPNVTIDDYSNIIGSLDNPEGSAIAVLIHFEGDIRGIVLFVAAIEDAKKIAGRLSGQYSDEDGALTDIGTSAIMEVGNILASSYLGSITQLTGLNIDISVPYAAIDMMGALLAVPMIEFSVDESKLFLVKEQFYIGNDIVDSQIILFADVPSLAKLMERLGADL